MTIARRVAVVGSAFVLMGLASCGSKAHDLKSNSQISVAIPGETAMKPRYQPSDQNPLNTDAEGTPVQYSSSVIQEKCQDRLGSCGGLKAMGAAKYNGRHGAVNTVVFTMYRFSDEAGAKTAFKAGGRPADSSPDDHRKPWKTATIGDESTAAAFYPSGYTSPDWQMVLVRNGSVIEAVELQGREDGSPKDVADEAKQLAKLQNDRLDKVFDGKSPEN